MIEPTLFSFLAEVFGLVSVFFASVLAVGRLRHPSRPSWRSALRPEGGRRAPLLAAGRRRKPPSEPPPGEPPSGSPPAPPSGSPPPDAPDAPPGEDASPQVDRAAALALMPFFGAVLRAVLGCGVPEGDAADVAQAVMLYALPRWSRLPIPADALEGQRRHAYLMRIAIGFASRYHLTAESRARFAARLARAALPELAPSPEDIALDSETITERAADAALSDLRAATSPDMWRAFYAHVVDGLPVWTIARLEGVPRATIYNRLRIARRDLRAAIERKRAKRAHERTRMLRARKGER